MVLPDPEGGRVWVLTWRRRSPSPRQIRFVWLTELVRAVHTAYNCCHVTILGPA